MSDERCKRCGWTSVGCCEKLASAESERDRMKWIIGRARQKDCRCSEKTKAHGHHGDCPLYVLEEIDFPTPPAPDPFCVCEKPSTGGVIHRTDGPCYRFRAEPPTKAEGEKEAVMEKPVIKMGVKSVCTKCGHEGENYFTEDDLRGKFMELFKQIRAGFDGEIMRLRDGLTKVRDIALKGHAHPEMTEIEIVANETLHPNVYKPDAEQPTPSARKGE